MDCQRDRHGGEHEEETVRKRIGTPLATADSAPAVEKRRGQIPPWQTRVTMLLIKVSRTSASLMPRIVPKRMP